VRADWTALRSKPGQARLMTAGSSCRYRVTVSVRALLGAPGSSLDRVTARMPPLGRRPRRLDPHLDRHLEPRPQALRLAQERRRDPRQTRLLPPAKRRLG
jgi:hypothetical protein